MRKIPVFLSIRGAAKVVGATHTAFAKSYHKGQTPKPDGVLNDNPIWLATTIRKYVEGRPERNQIKAN